VGEYEPGPPDCGFLFPAFTERSGDLNHVLVYHKDGKTAQEQMFKQILGAE
jgi:hypothetical protein